MKSVIKAIGIGIASLFLLVTPAFAHVIVYPQQVGIAAFQDFTMSVPNESNNPVVSVRLLIPKGVNEVIPNATQGWTITTKSSDGGNAVSEIDWTDGSIPVGQREEFVFQAQAPATPTTIAWKAYQTYSDGTIFSWDVDPTKLQHLSDSQQDQLADKAHAGEYSTTKVINDLAASTMPTQSNTSSQGDHFADIIAIVAVAVAMIALLFSLKKKK